jgi:hypothetical protein
VVWVGGTLIAIDEGQLRVDEALGARATIELLGAEATSFYRVSDGTWTTVPRRSVSPEQLVCIEALLARPRLLGLRVFLGTDCGPSVRP